MTRLDNWSVSIKDPYTPPELGVHLHGVVTGHPSKRDGTEITTSRITHSSGRRVTTKSGTVYQLGRIDPKYRTWLRAQGLAYDARNPIKIKQEKT